MSVKVDPVVIDEIVGWLLGWICGPVDQLFWLGWGLVEACGPGEGLVFPWGVAGGVVWDVGDVWGEIRVWDGSLVNMAIVV